MNGKIARILLSGAVRAQDAARKQQAVRGRLPKVSWLLIKAFLYGVQKVELLLG